MKGGVSNRLGSAARTINDIQSEVVKSIPNVFTLEKIIEGTIVSVLGHEGGSHNSEGGIKCLDRLSFCVKLENGKKIYINSPYNYGLLISTIGTPGNMIGKPVKIKYRGTNSEDISEGELSFTDILAKKQDEARVAQPYSIGFIHGCMGGLEGRDLLHKPSRNGGEF